MPKNQYRCGSIKIIRQKSSTKKFTPLPFNQAFIAAMPSTSGGRLGFNRTKLTESIFQATSECSKTAYLDYESELDAFEMTAASTASLKYRKGENKLFHSMRGVKLLYNMLPGDILVYRRLLLMMAHGFHAIWDKWEHIHSPTESDTFIRQALLNSKPVVMPLGLTSNVTTIFYLYFLSIVVSLLVYTVEVYYTLVKQILTVNN